MDNPIFWIQLGSLICTVIGGFFSVYRMVLGKFDELEKLIQIHRSETEEKIKECHARVDNILIELVRGKYARRSKKD